MSDSVQIQVGNDLIKPLIEQKVHAAIVEALRGEEAIVRCVVENVLKMKVDSDGKLATGYDRDRSPPFIEWLCKTTIRDAAKAALQAWAKENGSKIEVAVRAEIQKTATTNKFVKMFMDGMTNALASSWSFNVSIGKKD